MRKIVTQRELDEFDERIEKLSRPHSEMENEHYQALKNPHYVIEALPDLVKEQIYLPE